MDYSKVPLIKHPEIKDKARGAILDAVDDDWSVSELQPLVYVHIMEVRPYNNVENPRSEVGFTERMHNLLCNAGIIYLLDLVELTTEELFARAGAGMGVGIYNDLLWSLIHFDRYDECYDRFKKVMMPNPPDGDDDYRGGVQAVYGYML